MFRSGAQVRINVRLIDAASEENVWSESYERHIEDILTLAEKMVSRHHPSVPMKPPPSYRATYRSIASSTFSSTPSTVTLRMPSRYSGVTG